MILDRLEWKKEYMWFVVDSN